MYVCVVCECRHREGEREKTTEWEKGKRWRDRGMKLCHYASIKQKAQ